MKTGHTHLFCALVLLLASVLNILAQTAQKDLKSSPQKEVAANRNTDAAVNGSATPPSTTGPQKFVSEGLEIVFALDPVAEQGGKPTDLMEGKNAVASFRITDSRTGAPITNLHPSGWIDLRADGKPGGTSECRQKVQAFLQASLSTRPEIDLNTYFILTLNDEANISVIDPLFGYGNSKLFTLVFLKRPGEDWTLTADKTRLFVTMPQANQVASVDTSTWKVITNIDAGTTPTRIGLQPDEKYLWVGNDSSDPNESGVTVIDSAEHKVAARIRTGAGHHEIAFANDSRYAYVTNKQDGTVSIIDVAKLAKIKDLKTGALPSSLAFSPLSKAVYVASEGDGTITVIGGERQEALARIAAGSSARSIRFGPEGRYGFVVNGKDNTVAIFDSSTNRLLHKIGVGEKPDQISFTDNYAYVRALEADSISMLRLDSIGKSGEVPVLDFPGGQLPPGQTAGGSSSADSMVAAPEGDAVLVANPADKMIYYYSEGMAAPMGSFQNYSRRPRAVTVWDKSLRETKPGLYLTTVKLPASGEYDVAFLLDSPRIFNCFSANVKTNPALKKDPPLPITISPQINTTQIPVGESVRLQFQVTDSATRRPKAGLKDLGVLVFLAPGIWQNRQWAKSLGDGKYEVSFSPPKEGVYYVFVQCPSENVPYNRTPYFILQAKSKGKASAPSSKQ